VGLKSACRLVTTPIFHFLKLPSVVHLRGGRLVVRHYATRKNSEGREQNTCPNEEHRDEVVEVEVDETKDRKHRHTIGAKDEDGVQFRIDDDCVQLVCLQNLDNENHAERTKEVKQEGTAEVAAV